MNQDTGDRHLRAIRLTAGPLPQILRPTDYTQRAETADLEYVLRGEEWVSWLVPQDVVYWVWHNVLATIVQPFPQRAVNGSLLAHADVPELGGFGVHQIYVDRRGRAVVHGRLTQVLLPCYRGEAIAPRPLI